MTNEGKLGTGYQLRGGGLQNGTGGGIYEFYTYEKGGGGGKSFSCAEGGGAKKCWGSFYAVA